MNDPIKPRWATQSGIKLGSSKCWQHLLSCTALNMSTTAVHTFTLEPDNPSNTSIQDADGKVLYTSETVFPGSKVLTLVRNGDDDLLATLEWRDILSDKVTFRGETKARSVSDWLKKGISPFSTYVRAFF